ncbi:MAG TPA: YihY/virulence factor BrkB family protein [Gemmata sp.]|nr:YihY/virulence factor BrkB family protein [Gemmata sp.]
MWATLYQAAVRWSEDNVPRLSAAVAMYTILSLSPLLVITIKVFALILGEGAASHQVERQVQEFLGPTGANAVKKMITETVRPGAGVVATGIGLGILLITASGVFSELRDSLNAIWGVEPRAGRGWWAAIRHRFLSIGMVFAIGFLLLVSQTITTSLTVLSEYMVGGPGWIAIAIDLIVSTFIVAVLFGLSFRVLPDARLSWRDVVFGAAVTAVLFKVGQFLLALYFTYVSTTSAYGAAGSFVVVLLWVYYSCWIFFYGAELIQVRHEQQGRRVLPSAHACLAEEIAGASAKRRPGDLGPIRGQRAAEER